MGAGPINFDYTAWTATFPEFSGVSQAAAVNYFNMATMYIANNGSSPINDPNMLTTVLNLCTAHLAKIFSPQADVLGAGPGGAPSPLVGRIANASQGSVSVAPEMPDQAPNAAWWNQTIYGAAVWSMMKPYRTFRYIGPTKRRTYNPPIWPYSGWSGGWGGW